MRVSLLSVIAALCWCVTLPARADGLTQSLVDAYLGNPDLAAERANLRGTDELVPQALSGYRPQVFGTLGSEVTRGFNENRTNGFDDADGETSDIDLTTNTATATVQQNLYDGGGTVANVSRAENLVRAGRANLGVVEQSVLLEAVTAYTAAWRDRASLGEAINNEQRLERQLQAVRDRFDVGEVARTDVAQAEASLAEAVAEVESAKANVGSSDARYRRVIGQAPGNLEQPEPLLRAALPLTLDEALALAQNNPELIQATFDAAAANDDIDVQFAQLLPQLDLQGQLIYADKPTQFTRDQRAAQVGLTLTIPLFQGGAEYARVRQARQVFRQRRILLESAERSVIQDVSAAWETVAATQARLPAVRAQVRANEIALEGVQQEALVGTRTVLDVLDAEQEVFDSRVALVFAQAEEVVASYQLKSAVGQLTASGLALPVASYDPEPNYQATRRRAVGVKVRQ